MREYTINSRSIVIAATAIILSCGGVVMAKDDSQGQPPKDASAADFIKRLDKDGDGKVSKVEFDGPDEHFTKSDKNKDGYISEDEAPTGPPPGQKGQRGGRR